MRLAFAAMVLLIASAAQAADAVTLDIRSGVVLPANRARELLRQCSRSVPDDVGGTWLPTAAQIHDLEARLPAAFAAEIRKRHMAVDFSPLDEDRQYGGLIVGGRRIIYVNAFPSRWQAQHAARKSDMFHDDLKMGPTGMCDGGVRYFGVEYYPDSKTFAHFAFDGSLGPPPP